MQFLPGRWQLSRFVLASLALFLSFALHLSTTPAWAHSILESAEPAPGAQLSRLPRQLVLNFATPISTTSSVTIYDPNFQPVAGVTARFDPAAPYQLTADLPQLPDNTYTVQWNAVALDGHAVSGSYNFGLVAAGGGRWAFLRYLLPIYLALYLLLTAVWRSYVTWQRTGVKPHALGGSASVPNLISWLLRLVIGLLIAAVAIFAISPAWQRYLWPILWLEQPLFKIVGLLLLVIAIIWISLAQAQMGAAYRVSIDSQNATDLVQHGLFGRSRNPIFLGTRLTLLGFFLVLPSALTLLICVLGDVLIQIQVRLEEEFLNRQHGARYQEYRRRVRRWL